MTHYLLARELRGDPKLSGGNSRAYNNSNTLPLGPQREELVRVPSMGSFAVARSLSSQLKLDPFEIRSISDRDSWYDRGNSPRPSISPSIASSVERINSPHRPDSPDKFSEKASVADSEGAAENGDGAVPDGVLTGARLALVFSALLLCTFMFSLDQSIVATAIPRIVSDFNSFAAVAWLITAYFLTQCGFILLVGQLLTVIKAKWVLLGAVFFFELGSLLCALANGMTFLIVARAIQGIGAAGLFVAIMATIAVVTTVEKRSAFMAGFGFAFVVSSVIGPLLGGIFTEQLSWRWCFWINLPIGGVATLLVIFLLPARPPERTHEFHRTGWAGFVRMDWVGCGLSLTMVTCLLIALQWGGNDYPWGNWRIILLFTLSAVLTISFFAWEHWLGERALIPPGILRNRTVVAASGTSWMIMMGLLGGTYQLPLYYQASKLHSAQKSGIDIIPFMVVVCVGIFISSGFVTKFGYYYPFFFIGPPIAAVGFGMLFTVTETTSNKFLIGWQVLSGLGIGLTFQNIILSVQAEYARKPALLPQATGVLSFFQLTGAAVGVGIINTVQSIYLNEYLRKYAPLAPFQIVRQSTTVIPMLPGILRPGVIKAYTLAISKSYLPMIVAMALALFFGSFIRSHNMLKVGLPGAGGLA
ncbi:unnamed protein product [Cutaneotrichosporon oleaginosum]